MIRWLPYELTQKQCIDFAKASLLKESEKELDDVADILIKNSNINLDIEGHTSNDGSFNANMKLSNERAETVKNYLINKGIEASRFTSKGYGPTRPINDNKTREAKALNRRVELKLRNN